MTIDDYSHGYTQTHNQKHPHFTYRARGDRQSRVSVAGGAIGGVWH
ncbi:MAG: hypothetical protein MJE68_11375 [Proteobacteria bacterium]|nr:hypothetical protein [Pseudomonadota bacterium]